MRASAPRAPALTRAAQHRLGGTSSRLGDDTISPASELVSRHIVKHGRLGGFYTVGPTLGPLVENTAIIGDTERYRNRHRQNEERTLAATFIQVPSYAEGVAEVKRRHPTSPILVLWLGRSIASHSRDEVLATLVEVRGLLAVDDHVLLSLDIEQDAERIRETHSDPEHYNAQLAFHALKHMSRGISFTRKWKHWDFQFGMRYVPEQGCVQQGLFYQPQKEDAPKSTKDLKQDKFNDSDDRAPFESPARNVPGLFNTELNLQPGEFILTQTWWKRDLNDMRALVAEAGFDLNNDSNTDWLMYKTARSDWAALLMGRGRDSNASRASRLLFELRQSHQTVDRLFAMLVDVDTFGEAPLAPLGSPIIFELGHSAAFASNLLWNDELLPASEKVNPDFDILFARGLHPDVDNPSAPHDHSEVPADGYPNVGAVFEYVQKVRRLTLDALRALVAQVATKKAALGNEAVFVQIMEAEAMLAERLVEHLMALEPEKVQAVSPPMPVDELKTSTSYLAYRRHVGGFNWDAEAGGPKNNDKVFEEPVPRIDIPPGPVTYGCLPEEAEFDGELLRKRRFAWDFELAHPRKKVHVKGVDVDALPVTCEQFLEFIEDGGYQNEDVWTEEDWEWLQREGYSAPHGWAMGGDGMWTVRELLGVRRLDDVKENPVFVTLAEAEAFARWQKRRVMTESEYHRMAFTSEMTDCTDRLVAEDLKEQYRYPWGHYSPHAGAHGNFDFFFHGPCAVGMFPGSRSVRGVWDLVGNGWEWTSTEFKRESDFVAMRNVPGFSSDAFDGKHFVLLGASWATPKRNVRPSWRNFQHRHYRPIQAQFRTVVDRPDLQPKAFVLPGVV